MEKQMLNAKIAFQLIFGLALCTLAIPSARAEYEPNDNYSTFVVSFQTSKYSTPVNIGGELHDTLSGPAILYAKQAIPNLALGMAGSQLRSSGRSSSIKASNISAFLQLLAGVGTTADVGTSVAVLSTSTEYCTSIPNACTSASDNGTDIGVFGKVFLADNHSLSLTLSYNALFYQKASNQSVIGLTLVTILAKKHRLSLAVNSVRDSGGSEVSGGMGLSYSYVLTY